MRMGVYGYLAVVSLLLGCVPAAQEPSTPAADTRPTLPTDQATAPLLEGIGPLHFPISTDVPQAQAYFDQALTLAFGFNHAEAVRSFTEAARLDPTCGICYWGVALAYGPNINAPMGEEAVPKAWDAIRKALELATNETPRERAYIDALSTRYSKDGTDRSGLDAVYAGAMEGLSKRYPEDLHARTLYAESLMDLNPWAYWNADGSPGTHTLAQVAALESVIAEDPQHPGALHLYIHTMEQYSPHKAIAVADRLGELVPVAGHLVHMPSHIYLRVGRYHDAVLANERAASADENYIAQCNAQGFYPAAYYPHNIHFLWYSAMMEGQKALSVASALKLRERVPLEMARTLGMVQQFLAVPSYTYVRFGMWNEAVNEAPPPEGVPLAQAMWHYGRGIGYAALGQLDEAKLEHAALVTMQREDALAEIAIRPNEPVAQTLLNIATDLVQARIDRARNDQAGELSALQRAVSAQDSLPYTEPPFWHYPVRQSLGGALLRYGKFAEAQAVFAEDLAKFPDNGWSLFGMETVARQITSPTQSEDALNEYADARAKAWLHADIPATVGY